MHRRWTRSVVLSWLAASAVGCSDSIAPNTDLVNMALDFCASDAPVLFAYQNEGGAWTRVAGNGADTFTFQATQKVGIAFVHQVGGAYSTEVIFATADELSPLSGVACTESFGTKTLNGSVAGVSPGADAWITMAVQTAQVYPPPNNFQLTGLPNGPLDLVANRDALVISTVVPDRVIVRRGLNLTSGSTISTLDFASAEALAPVSNSLTISGLSANETNSVDVTFSTATALGHDLYYASGFTTSPQTIYSVPSTLTQAGDFHTLDLYAEASSGDFHGVQTFYRLAADRSVALGPLLSTPAFTTITATPSLRMRMTLPVQAQYNSFATAQYEQQGTVSREVFVTGTSGYFGSGTAWTLDMPDITGLSGYPAAAALESGLTTNTSAQAYGGSAALFFGGAPEEGATLKYAGTAPATAQDRTAAFRAGANESRVRAVRPGMHSPFLGRRIAR